MGEEMSRACPVLVRERFPFPLLVFNGVMLSNSDTEVPCCDSSTIALAGLEKEEEGESGSINMSILEELRAEPGAMSMEVRGL